MALFDTLLDRIGRMIADRLEAPSSGYEPFTPPDPETLRRILKPADVLLVESNQKVASAIKYLTQSTWSHAALYIGDALGPAPDGGEPCALIEANIEKGVVAVPLSIYASFNTRICRPVSLGAEEQRKVVAFAVARLGDKYDTRNIVDLARYLFPTPPVPVRWRRRMIALGSRRADSRHLFDVDRPSLSKRMLPDPPAHRACRKRLQPGGNPAHSPP